MATLNFVEIKNPFGSFEINPQAYTLWVPLLFFSHASVSRTYPGQLVGWLVGPLVTEF